MRHALPLSAFALALATAPLAAQQQPQVFTLEQAIALAQQNSHQSLAARATRDAARYRDRQFSSRLLPQLSLGGTLPQYNRSIIPVVQPDGTTEFRPQQQTNASLSASLSQTLPVTGGTLFVSSALARLQLSGTSSVETWNSTPVTFGLRQDLFRPNASAWDRREQNVRSTRDERVYREALEDVALSTTDLFFNTYAAKVALANAITNAATNDTLYRLNTGRFEVGRIGENDLLQSELVLLRSRSALDGARLTMDRAAAALRTGLGLPLGAPIDVAVTTVVPDYTPDTTLAVNEAMRNRSTVFDVELQDVQARRRVTEARLLNGPGATVQASFGYNATAPEAHLAYQDLREARQFTLSVQLPLWQWGAHGEGVRAAQADRERVQNTTAATMEQLQQDAHFAALQVIQSRRNVALLAKADTVAGRRFEVAYNRYVATRITIDILYIAQQEKDAALTQIAEGLRAYWQAHYRLRRATLYDFIEGHPIR